MAFIFMMHPGIMDRLLESFKKDLTKYMASHGQLYRKSTWHAPAAQAHNAYRTSPKNDKPFVEKNRSDRTILRARAGTCV